MREEIKTVLEWYEKEPYKIVPEHASRCDCECDPRTYDIHAIIQAVREEEREKFIAMFSAQNISGEPVSKSTTPP